MNKLFNPILMLFFLIAFSSCEVNCSAQQYPWPIKKPQVGWLNGRYNTAPVRNGYIVKMGGDTIRGLIKFLRYNSRFTTYMPILPTGTKTVIEVPRKDILYMRVYYDDTENNTHFSDFFNIDNNKDIWRLVAKKNDVAIYDNYIPDPKVSHGYSMVLMTESEKNCIYYYFFFPSNNINRRVLRFINRRYKTSFNKTDFKKREDMFDYILDKENEKEKFDKNSN